MGKIKIRYKFLIASVFLVFIVGAITHYITDIQLRRYIIDNYTNSTSNYINSLSRSYFNFSESFNLKSAGDSATFGQRLLKDNEYQNLVITDANGTILFAENKQLQNTNVHTNHNWQMAVAGVSFITETNPETNTLTNYVPLISENKNVRGVVYFNSSIPEALNVIESFKNRVAVIVIITSLIFMFFAYFIMYELENQMSSQERSITDASTALAEEQRLYEAITTSLAESLVVINREGQIILFNPEIEKLTGYRASEVEYRSYKKIINIFDERGKKIPIDPINEALKSGSVIKTSSKDGYYFKKDDNLIPINIGVAPIASEKSYIRGVAVTIENISAEKELQKVKDEFVYLVAHELGNPIFALNGYLTILEDGLKKMDKNTKEILVSAKGINSQLSALVNDLLEVSRNETGRLSFELEKIDLLDVFEKVIANESFKAKENNISIKIKKEKLPAVVGNAQKIKEVATNLVNNAIKYTPKNGKVEISFETDERMVTTKIKDNGIGLSEKNQKHLFEKFFRAKEKETEGISGTGLGLFISKQIIEKCGGKIWADSREHKGSTFSFTLRIAKKG